MVMNDKLSPKSLQNSSALAHRKEEQESSSQVVGKLAFQNLRVSRYHNLVNC